MVYGGSITDRSGTIAVGATSQLLMPANINRKLLVVQNNSTGALWVIFGAGPATQGQPSYQLAAGATLQIDSTWIPRDAMYIIGATAGAAFTAWEGS